MARNNLIYKKDAAKSWKRFHGFFVSSVFLVISLVLGFFGFNLDGMVRWSFLIVAGISFIVFVVLTFSRKGHKRKMKKVDDLDDLIKLDPFSAEEFMLNLLVSMGFKTQATQPTLDKGMDGIAKKDGVKYGVQCKRYAKGIYVSYQDMDKFVNDLRKLGMSDGIFITTSYFCRPAKEIAERNKIMMIDGTMLERMIRK